MGTQTYDSKDMHTNIYECEVMGFPFDLPGAHGDASKKPVIPEEEHVLLKDRKSVVRSAYIESVTGSVLPSRASMGSAGIEPSGTSSSPSRS